MPPIRPLKAPVRPIPSLFSAQGAKGKAGKRFTDEQREAIKLRVGELEIRGWSQREIAAEVGVSQVMVCKYLEDLHSEYVKEMSEDRQRLIGIKVRELHWTRREALEAWERSKEDATELRTEKALRLNEDEQAPRGSKLFSGSLEEGLTIVKEIHTRRGRLPDNRYMDTILKTIELECKMLGLTFEDDKQGNVQIVNLNWDRLVVPQKRPDPVAAILAEEEKKAVEHEKKLEALPAGPTILVPNSNGVHK